MSCSSSVQLSPTGLHCRARVAALPTRQRCRQQLRCRAAAELFPESVVSMAPKDAILGVTEAFLADPAAEKMNLGVGAYRDDNGKPLVLNVVREAERAIAGNETMEYLPIAGLKRFNELSLALALGEDAAVLKEKRVAVVQSLSGTGCCRLMAEFIHRYLPQSKVLLPKPTWSNHISIFRDALVEQAEYRYYKPSTKGLDFEGLVADLEGAAEGDVVLLHPCAHNPTGVDPTPDQWRELSKLILKKKLFPFFDMAYQGFASGDCERDAAALAIFLEDGHQFGLAQSYAKNMGLYGQRIGALSLVCSSTDEAQRVESQLKAIARAMYSSPPIHGALLVSKVLGDPELKQQWYKEVKGMADRIITARADLRKHLEELGTPGDWSHITTQIGMFCYSSLTPEQVDKLAQEHSTYLTRNGRISMAGVNSGNVKRLAEVMHAVITA